MKMFMQIRLNFPEIFELSQSLFTPLSDNVALLAETLLSLQHITSQELMSGKAKLSII